jgi:hypothetical protein
MDGARQESAKLLGNDGMYLKLIEEPLSYRNSGYWGLKACHLLKEITVQRRHQN